MGDTAFVTFVSLSNSRRGDNLIGEGDRKNPKQSGDFPPPLTVFPSALLFPSHPSLFSPLYILVRIYGFECYC